MKARIILLTVLIGSVLMIPAAALAQTDGDDDAGVLVRVGGDAFLEAGESADLVVVVGGDSHVAGTVETVVVISGDAVLEGAVVETVVVVSGRALLGAGTVVSGDVLLFSSTLVQEGDATIEGSVVEGFSGSLIAALWVFVLILAVGFGIVAIVSALGFAAFAPRTARETVRLIASDLGAVALAGLAFWIGLPIAAVLILITIIGIPVAFTIWFFLIPIVGFVGFLAAGIWLGDLILARGKGVGHPYLAAFLGTLLLVLAGLIPVFGGMIVTLASLLGGSALALLAWRNFRGDGGAEAVQTIAVEETITAD